MRRLNLLSQPELPWLFLPSTTKPIFFDPLANSEYQVHKLPVDIQLGYPRGSYRGGWLAVEHDDEQKLILFNFVSGQVVEIALTIVNGSGNVAEGVIDIVKIAFSRSPSDPDCQIAGVFSYGDPMGQVVALWDREQEHWMEIGYVTDCWEDESGEWEVQDILYHEGLFYLLTPEEHIIRVSSEGGTFRLIGSYVYEREGMEDDDVYLREENDAHVTKYLTESVEGDLLMCIKYTKNVTENFQIFKLTLNEATGDQTWIEYMGGAPDSLYLGHCCSTSHLTDKEDRVIHFLDDRAKQIGEGFDRSDMGGFLPDGQNFSYRTPVRQDPQPSFVAESDAFPPIWCSVPLVDLRP